MEAKMSIICQGAESKVFSTDYLGKPCVIKERLRKKYRVAELDTKINRQRLLQEARCLVKCRRAGISVPWYEKLTYYVFGCLLASACNIHSIYLIDGENNRLYMERIIGVSLKELLWANLETNKKLCTMVAQQVGAAIGKMHDADVVHGDLTTSNIMMKTVAHTDSTHSGEALHIGSSGGNNNTKNVDNSLCGVEAVLIDFGLGMMKPTIEDKAVDLYVLERAFVSTHPGSEYMIAAILEAYRFTCRRGTPILVRLEQVRMRGRKRDMNG